MKGINQLQLQKKKNPFQVYGLSVHTQFCYSEKKNILMDF